MIGAVDAIDEVRLNLKDTMTWSFMYDDVSGKILPKDLTVKARGQEMSQVYALKLYSKVQIEECHEETGQDPVGTKWLEING